MTTSKMSEADVIFQLGEKKGEEWGKILHLLTAVKAATINHKNFVVVTTQRKGEYLCLLSERELGDIVKAYEKLTEEEIKKLTGVEQKKALPVLHWLISMVRGRENCVIIKSFNPPAGDEDDVTNVIREFR